MDHDPVVLCGEHVYEGLTAYQVLQWSIDPATSQSVRRYHAGWWERRAIRRTSLRAPQLAGGAPVRGVESSPTADCWELLGNAGYGSIDAFFDARGGVMDGGFIWFRPE